MEIKSIHSLSLFFFKNLLSFDKLYHAISQRDGGISKAPYSSLNLGLNTGDTQENIYSNHVALSKAMQFDLPTLVSSHQVHGSNIIIADRNFSRQTPSRLVYTFYGYDALLTDRPGITLIIRVADCVPVILFDPKKNVLALIHAGWKGTMEGITAKTIRKMTSGYGSSAGDIRAGIGPSIGKCCFSVQNNVAGQFAAKVSGPESFMTKESDGVHIDLWEANRQQLISQGCPGENIEIAEICTSCNSHLFFSHRREKGKTGRFALVAGLRASEA